MTNKIFKQSIYFLLLFIIILHCKKTELNHPAEGAGGILIGIKNRQSPSVTVTGLPNSIDEDQVISFQVKINQSLSGAVTVKIASETNFLAINEEETFDLTFTSENATTDQTVKIRLKSSDKVSPFQTGISFSGSGISSSRVLITANYQFNRKVDFNGSTSITEEVTTNLKVKLRKKPQVNTTVSFSSNATSYITISPSSLSYTPDNFSVEQTISITVNDIYNDTRSYKIISSSEGDTTEFTFSVTDNDYAVIDLSTGLGTNSGKQPSIALDLNGNRIFVVTRNSSTAVMGSRFGRPLIYKCDSLYGTSCASYPSKTNSLPTNSGLRPNAVYDSTTQNLYFASIDADLNRARGIKIDRGLTGTIDCSANTATCNVLFSNPANPSPINLFAYPSSAGNILFVSYGSSNSVAVECSNSNLSSCGPEFSLGSHSTQALGITGTRGVKDDSINARIIEVATGNENLTLKVFNPQGTIVDLIGTAITSMSTLVDINNFGYNPDVEIDRVNNRLIISTFDYSSQGGGAGKPALIFCSLTLTGCSYTQLSTSLYPSYHPKLLWDSINKKILIITYNGNLSKRPYLHHCNESGLSCKETDLSFGQSNIGIAEPEASGYNFDAAIDTVNNRVLLVYSDSISGKLSLIRFGLGGF